MNSIPKAGHMGENLDHHRVAQMRQGCHVVCVCCGYGFPNGMAQTYRIHMVGKALIRGGCRFSVLNIGGGLCPNPAAKGTVDGIAFEHLPGPTKRYGNPMVRKFVHALGAMQTAARLSALRTKEENLCVFSWFRGGRRAWFHRYLRSIRCPVVQELDEWWPGARENEIRDLDVRLSGRVFDQVSELAGEAWIKAVVSLGASNGKANGKMTVGPTH